MKYVFPLFFFIVNAWQVNAQVPVPSHGKIYQLPNFNSKYIPSRNVDVWVPDSYDPQKRYAVLYMHDGKMLFDTSITWNHQEWKVDETLSQLMADKKIKDCIVVGVWNGEKLRYREYFPQKALAFVTDSTRTFLVKDEMEGQPSADNYLLFLTKELKPYIDQHFSTLTDATNTYVAGSSMGGLISMYAICEYPNVFGGAACISTHWQGNSHLNPSILPQAFKQYIAAHLPPPGNHKLYFDYGTATLDSNYHLYQPIIDSVLKSGGYNQTNWQTREYIGDDHSEKSWSRRFHVPMEFLLKRE